MLQEKHQKFAEYSLETFDCVEMKNLKEIIHGFFKFYAEEKSILKYEFSAFSAAQYARNFQNEWVAFWCEFKMMILSTSCRTAQVCLGFTASQMSKQDAENFMEILETHFRPNINVSEKLDDFDPQMGQSIESIPKL